MGVAASTGSLSNMEILLAYGANASFDHSYALRRAADDRNKTRLLLQHGADPDDRHPWRTPHTPFMKAVDLAELKKIQEMAKWKAEVEEVKKEDIRESRRDKYDQVMEAIRRGQEERERYIGERERERQRKRERETGRATETDRKKS